MEKLSIEEKAQAYDKALERAQALYNDKNEIGYANAESVLEEVFPLLKESEDEKTERILHSISSKISFHLRDIFTEEEFQCFDTWSNAWLEKQGKQESNKMPIWNHWKDGICGNGEGKLIYLIKNGDGYSLSSSLGFECDYILLSDLDKLMVQKKQDEPANKVEPKDYNSIDPHFAKPADKVEPKFKVGELKKVEDEEYNGEDYGIDGLWHAKNILEETLGKVDGYQTDDGILEHKCAITVVNKLYKQKPIEWHREDEQNLNACLGYIPDEFLRRWLKDVIHVKYDKSAWSEEDSAMTEVAINLAHESDILAEIERIINRRLNLLQGEYFNLEEETKDMTNELVDTLCSIKPTTEALRTEYEKGRADVIAKTLEWINVFNDNNYIMQYSDSCEHPINEIIEWYKNYINRE